MEDTRRSFWQVCFGGLNRRDRVNQRWATVGLLVWMAAWVAASLLLDRHAEPGAALTVAAVAVPTLLGLAAVGLYARFLAQAEELQRKIQVDALALGFGAGLLGIVLWELLRDIGLVDGQPAEIMIFMTAGYLIGIFGGYWRYR